MSPRAEQWAAAMWSALRHLSDVEPALTKSGIALGDVLCAGAAAKSWEDLPTWSPERFAYGCAVVEPIAREMRAALGDEHGLSDVVAAATALRMWQWPSRCFVPGSAIRECVRLCRRAQGERQKAERAARQQLDARLYSEHMARRFEEDMGRRSANAGKRARAVAKLVNGIAIASECAP